MSWFFAGANAAAVVIGDYLVEDVAGDAPQFKRVYSRRIDERATIKITIRTTSYGASNSGQLVQQNGAWVFFDPERIAEKILDRTLVPLVEKAVADILTFDKAYRKNPPR